MSQADAARAYLEKIGHAMPLEDIFKAVTSGGCKVGGADPKRTLSITLFQSKRDFVNTGGGNWGLRKFYPNMPKLGRPEGMIPIKKASAKRGSKKSAKRRAKPKTNAVKPKMNNPVNVSAAKESQVVQ
jgi:DNA-directed RNA polymerase delta subunit